MFKTSLPRPRLPVPVSPSLSPFRPAAAAGSRSHACASA